MPVRVGITSRVLRLPADDVTRSLNMWMFIPDVIIPIFINPIHLSICVPLATPVFVCGVNFSQRRF